MSEAVPPSGPLPERRRAARRRVSMADVARLAGVSAQTVSRVSTGHPGVIGSTRQQVLAAMRELGYRPNSAARALKNGEFRTIGVILFTLSTTGNSRTLEAIATHAAEHGYAITIIPVAAPTQDHMLGAFTRLGELAVDAAIVVMEVHLLDAATVTLPPGIQVVVVDSDAGDRYAVVDTDQADGARQAVRHLIGLGHRTVWHVAGPPESFAGERRAAAWRSELIVAGRPVPPLCRGDWSAESGYRAGLVLAADPDCTAVFAANDQMALGLLRAFHERGRAVPAEVSVVGFDDIADSGSFIPPLTTVHQDFAEVGRRCVEGVLRQIRDEPAVPGTTLVPTRLVVRDSTAAPPPAAGSGIELGETTVTRTFLRRDDLRDLVAVELGAGRRLDAVHRVAGGSNKGVYRLVLDDLTTVILYVWAAGESFWPPSPAVPDDPFTDASGAELFATNHAILTAVGLRVPRLLMLDRDGRHLGVDCALVEDAGGVTLETLLDDDPAVAAGPLAAIGDALRRMHTATGPHYGKPAAVARGEAPQARPAEDVIVDRALGHLDAAAARDARLAGAHERIAGHVRRLRAPVAPRRQYGLVHGELGPDHVLVTPDGDAVMIDIEGLAHFDVEWEHAWLQMRFGHAYPALRPPDLDPHRLELYRYAQVLSLIEGPLRIAGTDFPNRQWMLDLAEHNIVKALAVV